MNKRDKNKRKKERKGRARTGLKGEQRKKRYNARTKDRSTGTEKTKK